MIKEVYLLLSVRGLRMRKRLFSTSILIRICWAQVKIWSSEKPRYYTVEEWGTGTLQGWLIKISLGQGIRIWVKVVYMDLLWLTLKRRLVYQFFIRQHNFVD